MNLFFNNFFTIKGTKNVDAIISSNPFESAIPIKNFCRIYFKYIIYLFGTKNIRKNNTPKVLTNVPRIEGIITQSIICIFFNKFI